MIKNGVDNYDFKSKFKMAVTYYIFKFILIKTLMILFVGNSETVVILLENTSVYFVKPDLALQIYYMLIVYHAGLRFLFSNLNSVSHHHQKKVKQRTHELEVVNSGMNHIL